ncbi:uncharacterized protein LOC119160829 isoform X3 [Rhipicephalus microplus]|uniref:uncharacterized protein LOC119160829 isoform X3 n=1 Tax=Rhipicephalus microplus TaxID=6941 RepID=UPI0018873589|nr:uncharacterized protein LOC119160829 [Rhipicephalus microplus]XP_037268975.1 uncharacterized protein LOC119160829 [Rhipicephalus microplus]XP_037268976.1 uncharacterized protein LOC119160829 [Rhipicephalus microplus]
MMKKNDAYNRASSGMPKKPGQQKKYFKAASGSSGPEMQHEHFQFRVAAPTNPAAGQHLEAMNPRRRASAPVSPAEGHQQEDSVFGSTHPRSPASASASPAAGQQLENVNPRRHTPASVSPGLGYLMNSQLDETSSATSAVLTGPQMFACLTANANNQAEAMLKNVEKAAMTWFPHAAERAAAGQRRVPTNEDEAGY